ncbi:hypothetical protein V6N13_037354 [Hibiscus sabdariffa]
MQSLTGLLVDTLEGSEGSELAAACAAGIAIPGRAQRAGRLLGVRASKHGPPVNHLLFADDSLVFLRNDLAEVHCLKDILLTYSSVSSAAFALLTPPALLPLRCFEGLFIATAVLCPLW